MVEFIKNNKVWLGAILFVPIFFLYIKLSNEVLIPQLEKLGFSTPTNGVISTAVPVSIGAILLFQWVYLHLILSIRINQLIQLKHIKGTLVFLFTLILLLLLFQVFPGTRFESETPFTFQGAGTVIELIFGAYVEEVLYRGFLFLVLYDWFSTRFKKIPKKVWGITFIIFSSFMFALAHAPFYTKMHGSFHWLHLILPFVPGLFLSLIYWNTRNLLICIFLHFFINYRFFQFPLVDGGGQELSYIAFAIVIIVLSCIGQVIYKKGDIKYIDQV